MLENLTLVKAQELLKSGKTTAKDLLDYYFAQIEAKDEEINSFITLNREEAYKKAEEIDNSGDYSGIRGIPLGIKDIISTKGLATTCGSKMLENYVPPFDATVIKKLDLAGAIIVGKTNMDEFAMGGSNETSYFGTVKNPVDTSKVPGGSSGGSAAALSADFCLGTLGTDTGGSIRQPASLCGVVGVKPTYGLVSRYGAIAMASSLDQIGVFGKTVEDSAILLEAIAGHDDKDSTSLNVNIPNYQAQCQKTEQEQLKGLRIGVKKGLFEEEGLADNVKVVIEKKMKDLEKMGAEIVEVELSLNKYALAAYYILMPAEASTNLSKFQGVRYGHSAKEFTDIKDLITKTRTEGFGDEVQRRIILGNYVLSAGSYDAYYNQAQKVRALIKADYDRVFEQVDVIAGPTSPTVAWDLGAKVNDPLAMYLADIYTVPVNIAGLPGISINAWFAWPDKEWSAFKEEWLPVGIQLVSQQLNEEMLFRVGRGVEMTNNS